MMTRIYITLAIVLFSFSNLVLGQALVNNPCAGATLPVGAEWTLNAACVNISTAGFNVLANPGSCGSDANDDGWAWFTGDGNLITVNLTGLNSNAVLHVYELTNPPCAGIVNILCSNVGGTGNESINFLSILGNTYLIRIQRDNSNNTLTGCLEVVSDPPVIGCMDPTATNYNPAANINDGNCTYPGIDYSHPTELVQNEFVGTCLVNDCGPFNYADDGGPNNYSNDIGTPGQGGIYRVFCPDAGGQCMQATFNQFNTEAGFDYMTIGNGPTQNSTFFTTAPAVAAGANAGRISGNQTAATPFTYTSTDASGCLTFRFFSDNSVNAPGWNATLQCVPCAGGPSGTSNADCQNFTSLCSTAAVPSDASGPGIVSDGCTGYACPAGGENHSNWFGFTVFTGGSFDFTVTPIDPNDDYDFAIYGPNVGCGNLGAPLRCSDAAALGTTGTGGDTDFSEPAGGNAQVASMNVIAGEQYIVVVDEWSPNVSGTGYTLSFGGAATLDCSVLPVELSEFNAEYIVDHNLVDLFWTTESERDNDRFEVEHSPDGVNFEIINIVKGSGTTNNQTQYYVAHENPSIGVNYYRLNQFDFNGNGKYSEVRAVNILDDAYDLISAFPNPTSGMTEVIFNSYVKEEVNLKVMSSDGKIVVNTPLDAIPGGNRFDLDLSNHDRGLYFITITTGTKTYTTKVTKN